MTTNTPRTDTAPDDRPCANQMRANGLPTPRTCPTCKLGPCKFTHPSPSTGGGIPKQRWSKEAEMLESWSGGEPATDSAGREPLDVEFKRLADTILQATTNGTRLEALRGIAELFDKCAAREPAPVARELDVEAERRAFESWWMQGKFALVDDLSRKKVSHEDDYCWSETQLSWEAWIAARQSTAESAPASVAPRQKLREMHNDEGEIGWYFDCDGHYIDVERDENGKYSVYFRNREDGAEAWLDQADAAPSNSSPVGAKEK